MNQPLDLKQLRRVAEQGNGRDVVPVTRNWLRAALRTIEENQFPVLDVAVTGA